MGNENMQLNEIEEVEDIEEAEEAAERSNAGALAAGIAGGFLAFAMIGGAKKLKGFIGRKITERRQARENQADEAKDDIEIVEEQTGSEKETPSK